MNQSCFAILWFLPVMVVQGGTLKNVRGTIRAVNPEQGWYALVPDRDTGTRYAPEKPLAEAFQKDGLRVVFSGRIKKLPAGDRSWGIPLDLTRIDFEKPRK